MVLNEPLELALAVATNWLSKVMLTLWKEPKLLPFTRTLVPTEPLVGEIDAEGGGVGVGVGVGVGGTGVAVGGIGVAVGTGAAGTLGATGATVSVGLSVGPELGVSKRSVSAIASVATH